MPEEYDLLEWQKASEVSVSRWEKVTAEEREGKLSSGVLHSEGRTDYLTAYDKAVGLSK